MNRSSIKIAISCIGSGVGQSIINSIRMSDLPIKTVGFGINPFAYGAFDCDEFDYLPSIYSNHFIEELIRKCKKHHVDLLIPSLDDEVFIYAQNHELLLSNNINAIYTNKETVALFRDKAVMCSELNKVSGVFVDSFNLDLLKKCLNKGELSYPFIAKPKDGKASTDIHIIRKEEDLTKVSKNHIFQKLAVPHKNDPNYEIYLSEIEKGNNLQVSEISIQLIFSLNGELMGRMCSYNKLKNGVPIKIIPFESREVTKEINKLILEFQKRGVIGPINIQGRLTDEGLKIFEINPRFTGITGLRALMGFNEVEACIKEWLSINKGNNKLSLNYNRLGLRQTADKCISLERHHKLSEAYNLINDEKFLNKKTVFITGSTGYLGQNLINRLIKDDEFDIVVFSLSKRKAEELYNGMVKAIYDKDDLNNGKINLGCVDIIIHLGFTRFFGTNKQIADSLNFTNELFVSAVKQQVPAVINISTQGVYGLQIPPLWKESDPVAPETIYSQAKYATELMLKSAHSLCNTLHYSSIRLGALTGGAKGLIGNDFLSKFCKRALKGDDINIVGGMQEMELFHVKDAINAIVAMLQTNSKNWRPVYNLSSGDIFTLKDLATKVVKLSVGYNKQQLSNVKIKEEEVNMKFGMDSSLFCKDMKWEKEYSIDDTIKSLLDYLK